MTDKDTITQREVLHGMRQAVDHLPKHITPEIRQGVRLVLQMVNAELHGATSEEPFPSIAEERLRHHLYEIARGLVDGVAKRHGMSPRIASIVRGNLRPLDPPSTK